MKFRKRLLPLLLILSAVLPARADNVSREKAAETARAFFGPNARRVSISPGEQSPGNSRLTEAAYSSNTLAAFNREGGGFVVISLNDAVPPVLAWSPEGHFPSKEEMPDNMAWWFSTLEARIESLGADASASEDVQRMWEESSFRAGAKSGGLLYETANWSQDEPYNNNCPQIGTERCLTGCVATAGSIIARYFKWPAAGVGTVPGKEPGVSGADYPAHDLGHAYDWDNMPLNYGGHTSVQANAVATLMYDMGTIAGMKYGLSASSASSGKLLAGLKQYMKYNKGAYRVQREDYSDEQWTRMMKDNLDNCGPTLYSGRDPYRGGHTFVLDGYDAQGRFHFNWGWGFSNCYCEINSMVAGSTGDAYSENQEMVLELVPDYNGTSTGRDWISFEAKTTYTGLKATTDVFEKNKVFVCSAGWLRPNVSTFSGSFYFSLYDKAGNLKEDISLGAYKTSIELGAMKAFSNSCVITCDIEPGDRIKVRYVGQNNEGIVDAGAGCVSEIIVKPDTGGPDPDPTAGYTAAQTAASTSLSYAKASATLTLTFTNPANWTVKNSGGTIVANGTAAAGGPVAIDLSGYAAGTYTVLVGSHEDPFTFTITK